jgi:hypothetical protein
MAWYKRYRGNEYIRNNRRIVGRVVFYAVRVVSKKSRRLILLRTSCYEFWGQSLKNLAVVQLCFNETESSLSCSHDSPLAPVIRLF